MSRARLTAIGRALSIPFGLAALAFLAWTLAASGEDLIRQLARFDPLPFALGVLLMLAQSALVAAIWREVLALQGDRVEVGTAYRLIFLAALGKYLPGKVWSLGGIAVLSDQAGIPVRAAMVASTATVAIVAASGAVVGVPAYLIWRAGGSLEVLGAAAAVLVVVPWAAGGLLDRSRVAVGLRAIAAANLGWVVLGIANWSIARAIEPVPLAVAAPLLASNGAAWAAGLAAVAVPAGLGVREAVQTLALADVLPPPTAAAVALLTRVALVIADLAAAAIAVGLPRPARSLDVDAPLPDH